MSIQVYFKEADLDIDEKQYIENRLEKLANFIHKISSDFDLKISLWNNNGSKKAKKDFLPKVEILLNIPKSELIYVLAEGKTIKSAFDDAKDKAKKEIIAFKNKQLNDQRAGQKLLKQVIRGYFKK